MLFVSLGKVMSLDKVAAKTEQEFILEEVVEE